MSPCEFNQEDFCTLQEEYRQLLKERTRLVSDMKGNIVPLKSREYSKLKKREKR